MIDRDCGDPTEINSPSDIPKNRQQIYNIRKGLSDKMKCRNTGKVTTPDCTRLLAFMCSDVFLRNVSFVQRTKHKQGKEYTNKSPYIYPNTFAATENALEWTKQYCQPSASIRSLLGIDMTYKVGPFYTTIISFAHPMFVYRNDDQKHPTIFAGMMTSTTRDETDYNYLATQLGTQGIKTLIYGTDGEYALEKGMENKFPIEGVEAGRKSIKLRCFNQVRDNLEAELKELGIKDYRSIVDSILGREFGDARIDGLVDCETVDFREKYAEEAKTWPSEFQMYMESRKLWVRPLKETLLLCMGRDTTVAGGLGDPPNKFDNQRAESLNNVFKEAADNRFVDQSAVHTIQGGFQAHTCHCGRKEPSEEA